jgi:molecular chaperone HscB
MSPEPVVNFFELFGVPTTFAIDARRLDRAYRELQTQVHPDRHAAAGNAEQLHAARWAMLANEAYHTLKDAVGRACHLLHLHGIDALDPARSSMPRAFLVEQMAWRERIDDARGLCDTAALDRLEKELADANGALERELAHLLDSARDYTKAAETIGKLRFLGRLREDVELALEDVAPDTMGGGGRSPACAPPS